MSFQKFQSYYLVSEYSFRISETFILYKRPFSEILKTFFESY